MPAPGQVKRLHDSDLMAWIAPILDSLAVYRQRAAEYNAMFTLDLSSQQAQLVARHEVIEVRNEETTHEAVWRDDRGKLGRQRPKYRTLIMLR